MKVTIAISRAIPVITVSGIKGASCKQLTKELEEALGKKTKDAPTKEITQSHSYDNTVVH